ncbi:hypothetical protein ACVJGD_008130 [Bradyrhizobium sp. USDA 10063]
MFEKRVVDGAAHTGETCGLSRPNKRCLVRAGDRTSLVGPHSRWCRNLGPDQPWSGCPSSSIAAPALFSNRCASAREIVRPSGRGRNIPQTAIASQYTVDGGWLDGLEDTAANHLAFACILEAASELPFAFAQSTHGRRPRQSRQILEQSGHEDGIAGAGMQHRCAGKKAIGITLMDRQEADLIAHAHGFFVHPRLGAGERLS